MDAVGSRVRDLAPGQRVAFLSERAFAEYDLAPAATAVPLPDSLDGAPFPGEAIACAVNGYERSRIEPRQHVAVLGVGFLGALVIQLAARYGARVLAISRRPYAREVARACGAEEAIAWDADAARRALDWNGGRGFPRVIEAVGLQQALDLATALTAERAVLVIAGYHQDGPRTVDLQMWNWRGLDVVNAHERDPRAYVRGMRRGVEHVLAGRIDLRALVTHRFPLDGLGAALDALRDRPERFLKAVVVP